MDQSFPTNSLTPSRQKMSSSLKEKLKRLGRYHGLSGPRRHLKDSPLGSTPTTYRGLPSPGAHSDALSKHPLPDHSYASADGIASSLNTSGTDKLPLLSPRLSNKNITSSVSKCGNDGSLQVTEPCEDLQTELKRVQGQLNEKEETLRKLKLVKLYRTKNDLVELQSLIVHWRVACQEALLDFQSKSQDPKPSMVQLLRSLKIDFALVKYNLEEDGFDSESV